MGIKISPQYRKIILDELDYVINRMGESKTRQEKLYFFSGTYGTMNRILNIEFDPALVFINHVLQTTFGTLNEVETKILHGQERVIKISDELYEKLEENIKLLRACIEEDKDVYQVLENISNLNYLATGNGYYLYTKGIISL